MTPPYFWAVLMFVLNLYAASTVSRHFLTEIFLLPLYAVLQTFPSGSRRFVPTLSRQSSADA